MNIEVLIYFLRLGCLGFGGPLALVAQMQTELVDQKKWISREEFLQTLALLKAMPGPLAFSTATYLGHRRAGFWGATIAGWSLVFPAFLIMLFLARFYDSFSSINEIQQALVGMQAAALAMIIFSIQSLGRMHIKHKLFWCLLILSGIAVLKEWPEPFVIVVSGGVAVLLKSKSIFKSKYFSLPVGIFFFDERVLQVFVVCFKAGAFVFGTGLAIVPLLESGFVTETGWLTHTQFLDALSFGQMTPGPVLITATFAGYKVAGFWAALAATVGVFLASYVHMTTWFPRMGNYLRQKTWISAFTLGAIATVSASLIVSSYRLLQACSGLQISLVVFFLGALVFWKVPSWAMIIGGAAASSLYFGLGFH